MLTVVALDQADDLRSNGPGNRKGPGRNVYEGADALERGHFGIS